MKVEKKTEQNCKSVQDETRYVSLTASGMR